MDRVGYINVERKGERDMFMTSQFQVQSTHPSWWTTVCVTLLVEKTSKTQDLKYNSIRVAHIKIDIKRSLFDNL